MNKLTIEELVLTEGWINFNKKLELYCSFIIGALLLMFLIGKSDTQIFRVLTVLALLILSTVCFFIMFKRFESDSKVLKFFFYRIYGIGLSIGYITLMFRVENWPFPVGILTLVSILLILLALLLGLRERFGENKNAIDWKYFIRILLALIPLLLYLQQ